MAERYGANKRQIGLFGGSFNPIHRGHIALARYLLQHTTLDEIWFVISPQNPLKNLNDLLNNEARLLMVECALANEPQMKPCTVEFEMPLPSYTWNTLKTLDERFPYATFTLLIGGDNWESFPRWYRHDEIIANYHIIVYPRPGATISGDRLPAHVSIVEAPLLDISSTAIRQRISEGKDIDEMVPDGVGKLIREYGYYR